MADQLPPGGRMRLGSVSRPVRCWWAQSERVRLAQAHPSKAGSPLPTQQLCAFRLRPVAGGRPAR